jgi:hypothetical protein
MAGEGTAPSHTLQRVLGHHSRCETRVQIGSVRVEIDGG